MDIKSLPERISKLRKYVNNHYWSGQEFPLSIKEISKSEKNNDIPVNLLGVEEKKVDIQRTTKRNDRKNIVDLLTRPLQIAISDGEV